MSPTFNGKFFRTPAVSVKTNVSSFVNFGLAPGGIVAILGTSTGGVPNTVQRFTDPTTAAAYFKSGNLITAANNAWEHGAQTIYMTRIGNALQATNTITNESCATIATISSQDYGSYTNDIQYKVETGTSSTSAAPTVKFTVSYYDSSTNRTTIESLDDAETIGEIETYFNDTLPSTLITITSTSSGDIPDVTSGYVSLVNGSDGDPITISDWSTALNLYTTEFVNILHPAMSTDSTVHALFKTHVETYSNQKMERTAVVGGNANDPIGDTNTEDSLVYRAYNLNSERMVLVAPGTDGQSAAYTASKIVGLIAGYDVATPITYKTISATSIATKYTQSEKDTLVKYGILTIEEVPQGRRVVRGITTVQDVSEYVEDSFKEYSIQRIKDYLTDNIRTILESTYIGKKGITGVISQMQTTVTSVLSKLKEAEIIKAYQNVTVEQDVNDAKVYNISYDVAPVSPINWIFITQNFVSNI